MNADSVRLPPPAGFRGIVARIATAAAVAAPLVAHAQQSGDAASRIATGAVVRPGFIEVFGRLEPVAVVLIVGAAVILVLLAVSVALMVRRERPKPAAPSARSKPRPKEPVVGDALGRPSTQRPTDWGQDQNTRGAVIRESVPLTTTKVELPSLDQAITQWTISEVQQAAAASRGASETMGRPTGLPASPYRTAFNPYFRGESAVRGIDVVEVADAMLQAELLVQLGDPKQAMTLLSQHIRETEKPGPAVWLMLLGLYQTTGRKSQYEALSKGFGMLFNAAVPPWPATKDLAARDVESYPQVMMKLHTQWGKPQLRATLEGLLNDDRGGSRQGFSLAAYRDLLFLLEIVNELDKMQRDDDEKEGILRKLGRIA